MASHSVPAAELSYDLGLRRFFLSVFGVMALGLAITGVTALLIANNPTLLAALFHLDTVMKDGKETTQIGASGWWWLSAALQLGIVWWLSGKSISRAKGGMSKLVFLVFAVLNGVTLTPVLFAYTQASAATIFFLAAATFGGSALVGYVTKIDLQRFGGLLLMGLIGLIIAMVVNLFLGSSPLDYLISGAAVILFVILTAFDIQRLKQLYAEGNDGEGVVVYGALALYLDFMNLFIHLLRLFGVRVGE